MSISLDHLNPDQRRVVLTRGHCIVVATAGSGKTSTVATKAAYALAQEARVAAVTFTKEAALELRERIVKIAGPSCSSRLLVGTFHSVDLLMANPGRRKSGFGRTILDKQNSPYERSWQLVNSGVQFGYVNRAMKEASVNMLAKDAISQIELIKAAADHSVFEPDLVKMVEVYQGLLASAGVIDMQDILLLTNKALRAGTMSPLNIDYLFIDEFQDTDAIQYEWMMHHAKAGPAITAVGDDDQSIYGFRRALGFDGMERMRSDLKAEQILLGTNYRCRKEILGAAELLIGRNSARIPKRLFAQKGEGGFVTWEAFNSVHSEANALAEEAALALEEGATFAAIARTNRELIEIQKAMVLRNLPFKKADGKSLFDYPEVQAYGALLRTLIADKPKPNDVDQVLAWAGMSAADTNEVRKLFGSVIRSGAISDFSKSSISSEGRDIWRNFAKKHNEWKSLCDGNAYALLNIGVREWMLDTLQKPNQQHVVETAADLFAPKNKTLAEHLAHLKQAEQRSRDDERRDAERSDEPENCVWLLTAHSSKGLEFDRVWIVGLQTGQFPSEKSSLEEERRLMFVAMTRAKESLWISATKEKKPSVFLFEAGLLKQ